MAVYRDLVRKYPAVPELWFELGNAASGELDFAQANLAYRRALELAPSKVSLLCSIGQQYHGLRQRDGARACYEDVVANLEPQGRRVTEFLGLSWHPDQARYYETAKRKLLFAPTYRDVTQPVYKRAVGRWERYAEALAPIQPRLAPSCRAFGYPA